VADSDEIQEEVEALGKRMVIVRWTTEKKSRGNAKRMRFDKGELVNEILSVLNGSEPSDLLPVGIYGDGLASLRIAGRKSSRYIKKISDFVFQVDCGNSF
jgi:hypothetical protein